MLGVLPSWNLELHFITMVEGDGNIYKSKKIVGELDPQILLRPNRFSLILVRIKVEIGTDRRPCINSNDGRLTDNMS